MNSITTKVAAVVGPTVAEICDYWREQRRRKLEPKTYEGRDRQLRLFCQSFGERPAASLTPAEVSAGCDRSGGTKARKAVPWRA